jgi:Protein of unknown function (DUF1579)
MQLVTSALALLGALSLGVLLGHQSTSVQPDPSNTNQDAKRPAPAQERGAQDGAPDMAEMMAAMERAGTPAEHHKLLDVFVGDWSATVKMWMDPAGEPMVMQGTMSNSWAFGGRYLKQSFSGNFMEQPFEGMSLWGYDIAGGFYNSIWVDNMGTTIASSTGAVSADGKTFTMNGSKTDPMTGKPLHSVESIVVDSADQHTMVAFDVHDGQRIKTMEIVYQRKK